MERFVGPDAGETRAPFPELTPKRRERLLTLIARSLHPYVCGSDLPGIPECAQRARAVVEEWEADEVSR